MKYSELLTDDVFLLRGLPCVKTNDGHIHIIDGRDYEMTPPNTVVVLCEWRATARPTRKATQELDGLYIDNHYVGKVVEWKITTKDTSCFLSDVKIGDVFYFTDKDGLFKRSEDKSDYYYNCERLKDGERLSITKGLQKQIMVNVLHRPVKTLYKVFKDLKEGDQFKLRGQSNICVKVAVIYCNITAGKVSYNATDITEGIHTHVAGEQPVEKL